MAEVQEVTIRPQPGPQEQFLSTPADMAVYGGSAGSGKSWALLMEPLRHVHNPLFSAVIFRLNYPMIMNEGGLWDTSEALYRGLGAKSIEGRCEWIFPSGATIRFAHMQSDKDRYSWDSSQIPFIGFDQLESFSWKQFSYMLSRNRSMCGVKPYIRATCNPLPDHFLRDFMRWWIDDESGYPIPGRSGVVRWFIMLENQVQWGDSTEELKARFHPGVRPKSFTFIPGAVEDNQILLQTNPEYLANLEALPLVDRLRLRAGNWNARESAGLFFQKHWFETVEAAPPMTDVIRYWDRASTDASKANPLGSWTAGVKMGRTSQGVFYVLDVVRFQGTPLAVETAIKNTAAQDGRDCLVGIEVDPGQAGVSEAQGYVRRLAGYNVRLNRVHEAKGIRARPFSAQAEAGNVKVLRRPWTPTYIDELTNFDGGTSCLADQTDSSSGAFFMLATKKRGGTW